MVGHLVGVLFDGVEDLGVAGAPAQVADQRVPDLLAGRAAGPADQVERGQDHAGGAEAALRGAAAQEALLQRVHGLAGAHQPAQRGHLAARGLHGQGQAAVHRLAVQQHGAGAADALAAAVADVGQAELVVQHVEQGVRRQRPRPRGPGR